MADYTQITSFAPKDALTTGNPAKKIRGAEFDPEFAAIATAIQTKFDSSDIAANAEASALTGDSKLITPGKLAYALQNGTLVLGPNIQLNGGIAATDVARKGTANTFTATQTISNTIPRVLFLESDQSTDNQKWDIAADTAVLVFRALNGAESSVANAIAINRGSGAAIAQINITATSVLVNGATAWHAANDGSGSGLDADLLDGLNRAESVSPNTVPSRDGSSDLFTRYFNSSATNGENPTIGQFMVTNGSDGYIRKASLVHVQSQLGVPTLANGTFVPGVTSVQNCTTGAQLVHRYSRVGNIVTVSGGCNITVTSGASVLTKFSVNLPIASDFTSSAQAHGAGSTNVSNGSPAWVDSEAISNSAMINFYSSSSGAQVVYYTFQYEIA
jgi:hypothetical protein